MSPIADLSYRNYDGPLLPPVNRWWAIARMSIRLSLKKKGFWIWSAISAYWYLVLLFVFYFIDSFTPVQMGQKNPILQQIVWKDQFLNAFSTGQLLYFILALLLAVGAIANDSRANALLVYLSKPCTKTDYLIGKWLGVFVPLTVVTAVPTFVFYVYCLMSYRQYGFVTEDPMLPLKLVGMCLVPGAVHSSLALGVSSLFNQGRLAGATYAGAYFFTNFFTVAMKIVHATGQVNDRHVPEIVNRLYYCSIDGIQIGLAKLILSTDGSPLFPGANGRRGGPNVMQVPMPPASFILPLALVLCVGGVAIAWSRIRAVEVVG